MINHKYSNGDRVWFKLFRDWSSGIYIGLDIDGKKHVIKDVPESGRCFFTMENEKVLPWVYYPNDKASTGITDYTDGMHVMD